MERILLIFGSTDLSIDCYEWICFEMKFKLNDGLLEKWILFNGVAISYCFCDIFVMTIKIIIQSLFYSQSINKSNINEIIMTERQRLISIKMV